MIESLHRLRKELSEVVIGKEEVIDLLMVGMLAEGHVLIEDIPGVGKTLMAKALAVSLDCDFRRLQCTPDLTPTDVSGFNIFDRRSNEFTFKAGPVLTNILLVDEINRAVPRTQSSLLEAMEEKQISVDGQTFHLPQPFFIMATQNPIELEGTFPLPEAQLDRFLLKISMGYPTAAEEEQIIMVHGKQNPLHKIPLLANKEDVKKWQEECQQIHVKESLRAYLVSLVRGTREHPSVALGASPRATLAMLRAARALAFIKGRDYVTPDDIKYLAKYVICHRLIIKREDRLRGIDSQKVVEDVLSGLTVPVEEG
ncbi:MAG: magnesium chelatase [Firmicutes bacterium HGW-Firmicutes-12]|nr:MAG: magnesium chelatase [Firmicutes bacterium HGW-Firmicutes-12]